MPRNMINLAIIDSSRMFADVLATRLGAEPDMRVLRCATGSAALQQAVSNSAADVVLGDAALFDPEWPRRVHRPGAASSGARASGEPRRPHGPLVILLVDPRDSRRLATALRLGVRGLVPRDSSVSELISAIREVVEGGTWVQPKLLTAVLDELTGATSEDNPGQAMLADLTPREREVLSCLVNGLARKEVAEKLKVSPNTVRTHVQNILSKLEVNSCVAAVALVRRASTERTPVLRVLD